MRPFVLDCRGASRHGMSVEHLRKKRENRQDGMWPRYHHRSRPANWVLFSDGHPSTITERGGVTCAGRHTAMAEGFSMADPLACLNTARPRPDWGG
jgi:hypothetical protein